MTIDTDRLRPMRSSYAGFLNETESFDDVLKSDRDTLRSLGLTYDQFADRLLTLTEKAHHKANLCSIDMSYDSYWDMVEQGILVEKIYKVSFVCYMGYQECPFDCDGREALSDRDYTITNTETGESIFFSELHIHLIREHHFFEGHTEYRLDPEQCARVLNIKSGQDYSPQYVSKEYWVRSSGGFSTGNKTVQDYINDIRRRNDEQIMSGEVVQLEGKKMGWRNGDSLYIISLDPEVYESVIIDGTPVQCLQNGAYNYSREEVKWVDDEEL